MAEKTKKNEFIEIEFVGLATGEIFDTNIKEKAEKINLKIEEEPLIVCIGQGMLVKGFDRELEEKEIGKKYTIHLASEDAFGKRNKELVRIIPSNVFRQKDIHPMPGMVLNLDGFLAKILSVSGGRIITDFNNPLAGKEIEYEFTIKRKITDDKEKINALQDFFFKKRFDFNVDEKTKKIIFKKEAAPFLTIFIEKFKEILGKEIGIEKVEEKLKEKTKTEKKEEKRNKEKEKGQGKETEEIVEGKKRDAKEKEKTV